ERIERATLTRYTEWLGATRGLEFEDYQSLWRWSVDELEAFWGSIVEFFDIHFESAPEHVLGRSSMPGAEWFGGGRLSYPEHMFRGRDPDAVAIRHASELRPLGEWTWSELSSQTAAVA